MLQKFFKNKNISNKLKLRLKNTIIDKALTYASETWILSKRDRKQMNIFERTVFRRILGPIYDKEKENWKVLTDKEIYAIVKNPAITETIRLDRLRWFRYVQRVEGNRIPKEYYIWIWEQQDWEVGQEIDGKMKWERMEE